jgi:putative acetyltransferase
MPLVIEQVSAPTDDVRMLIAELDAELNAAYSAEQRHGLNVASIFQPGVMFFIARLDGAPVGCGGVAFEDGFAEVKRMYVRPHARRKNVAMAIINRLEQETRLRRVGRMTLETGDAQKEALHFYRRAGFTRCTAFGQYALMPPESTRRSVFFEKHLS